MNGSLSKNCVVCEVALDGVLGTLSRLTGIQRSDGNPNLCNRCNEHVAEGTTREIGVFFADLSNYTTLTGALGPDKTHEILDAFLRTATEIITGYDGYVSQYVGDEVMALFNTPIINSDYAERAVKAASKLQGAIKEIGESFGIPLTVTIGIGAGHARVGHVGREGVAHFSAIGDVVNRAARLVAKSEPGGLLVDEAIYGQLNASMQTATLEAVRLKGFSESFVVARYGDAHLRDLDDELPDKPASLNIITSVAALLSAPCAGYLALNSMALALGGGAFSMGALAMFFDQNIVRVPLLSIAALGAAIIGGLTVRQYLHTSRQDNETAAQPTVLEKRRNRLGLAVSSITLTIVIAELFAHNVMH